MAMGFRKTAALAALLIAFIGAATVWALFTATEANSAKTGRPLPVPNGYDKILEAAQAMGAPEIDSQNATPAQLATMVESNRTAYMLLPAALEMESMTPFLAPDPQLEQLATIKRLATAVVGAGRHAIHERRYVDAARHFLDTIRLGQKSSRGGPLMASMVGTAISRLGLAELERLVPHLDAKTSSNTVPELEKLLTSMESPEEVLENEKAWVYRTHGRKGLIMRWVTKRQLVPAERRTAAAIKDLESRMRTLVTRLHEQAAANQAKQP